MTTAEELLTIAIIEKRTIRAETVAERQLDEAARQEFSAQVVRYDAEKAAWKVKRTDGTLEYAKSVQRLSPGSRVFLQKSNGGNVIDYL